jgi:hypothetical protein
VHDGYLSNAPPGRLQAYVFVGLVRLNIGGRKRSGAFDMVWPTANMLMMMSRDIKNEVPLAFDHHEIMGGSIYEFAGQVWS